MDEFRDSIAQFDTLPKDSDGVPCVAVSLPVIRHFVRGKDLANFEGIGFFMYHGVKVYEKNHVKMPKVLSDDAA